MKSTPKTLSSTPDVFIIESLYQEQEEHMCEGKILAQTLRMFGKKPRYVYIRTKLELEKYIKEFEDSDYRYLHLSFHGDETGIDTTFDRNISNEDLAAIIGPALHERRLFLSACEATTLQFAEKLAVHGDFHSVTGFQNSPDMDDAVVMWILFYQLIFKNDSGRMVRKDIVETLGKAAALFKESLNFFYLRNGEVKHRVLPTPAK